MKGDGRQRPLGVAVLEDKIVQRAMTQILNQIYETDFQGVSYGFRPGRSQHQALDALTVGIERKKVNWILDLDIRGFFDNLDHEQLVQYVEERIADPRILRLIRKWLKAGVMEDGEWKATEVGTPQGSGISPLLANVYLHYALDLWVLAWRRQARGDVIMVRYADDAVLGFENRDEAERLRRELQEQLRKVGLELHPEKTRMIEFGRFAESNRKRRGEDKPETFDFLGFTHMCGKTRTAGRFTVRRKTIGKRMRAKLQEIRQKLRLRMHDAVPETGKWLRSVVQGYFNYHAVPGNGKRLQAFRDGVVRYWRHTLRRRSQTSRIDWERMDRLVRRWIPSIRIMHPYPNVRFDATHPRKEPYAGKPLVRICAGGSGRPLSLPRPFENPGVAFCRNPNVTERKRVVKSIFASLERNQAHAVAQVKLKNVATVVESFVAVRRPKKIVRIGQIQKLVSRKAKELVLEIISIERMSKCIGEPTCVQFLSERSRMKTATRNPVLNFIERAGKRCSVGLV